METIKEATESADRSLGRIVSVLVNFETQLNALFDEIDSHEWTSRNEVSLLSIRRRSAMAAELAEKNQRLLNLYQRTLGELIDACGDRFVLEQMKRQRAGTEMSEGPTV